MNNAYKSEVLFFFSLICIYFGLNTIVTKNPILSVLSLIGLFFTVAVYLITIGLYFIGISYLLVYVGAISILFLFILMLINVRVSELLTEGTNSLLLALLVILGFNYKANTALPYSIYPFETSIQPITDFVYNFFFPVYQFIYSNGYLTLFSYFSDQGVRLTHVVNGNFITKLANVYSIHWDSILIESSHVTSIGNLLYSNLFILLIVTSFILLLAMVGSIVITIKDKSETPLSALSK